MVTLAIIFILAATALPLTKNLARRAKEIELRQQLQTVRAAIDDFHRDWNRDGEALIGEACKKNKLTCKEVSSDNGYPKTLENLLSVELTGELNKTIWKYLRKITPDPITKTEWGLRCYVDPPDAELWCQEDIYDIYTTSNETALDGTRYRDW
ncbi:MAG: type II secretion system protein [Nitrospirae bacterium]|nr:type II secretion system protein [Candidatus Manganitrophaceae bacterium]